MRRYLPLLVLLLGGCAYYNGMYNANRFAKRAKKSEAKGRTFEAQGYWAQAEVRADSVIVRHPTSTWVDEAQLIRGEAMISRGDCASAIPALEKASLSRDNPKVVEQAQVLLGHCRLDTGDLTGADQAFVALMASPDTAISQAARLQHAVALRQSGSYQEALTTLEGLHGPTADDERAADYAGLGEIAAARPLVDSAIAHADLALPWESTLAGIGRVDPGLASQLTSEVVALPGITGERRDALLVADGMRLLPANPDSGLARLREAAVAKPVTSASLLARLRIAEFTIQQADTFAGVELAREGLTSLSQIGGPSSIRAIDYLRVMDRLRGYADSVSPEAARGDLATFVIAEQVRDGLPAPRIAAEMFATIPTWWPTSPYAPKALLALAALEPTEAESILHTIECVYPESPYLLLVAGDLTPAVLALEDSLQAYGSGAVGPASTPTRRRPAASPAAGQRPQDELR